MRISRFFAVILTFVMPLSLAACQKGLSPEDAAGAIQEEFRAAGEVKFSAGIRADYGDRLFDCGVSCSSDDQGGVITVAEPELIAGVTVRFSGDGAALSYDGAEVFTGEILPEGLSPVDAVPLMLRLWREGLVTEAVFEKWGGEECLAALFHVDDRVEARTWFTRDTGLPLRCEIYLDGYTVIGCDLYNVILVDA